jgi:hypothetical protein
MLRLPSRLCRETLWMCVSFSSKARNRKRNGCTMQKTTAFYLCAVTYRNHQPKGALKLLYPPARHRIHNPRGMLLLYDMLSPERKSRKTPALSQASTSLPKESTSWFSYYILNSSLHPATHLVSFYQIHAILQQWHKHTTTLAIKISLPCIIRIWWQALFILPEDWQKEIIHAPVSIEVLTGYEPIALPLS